MLFVGGEDALHDSIVLLFRVVILPENPSSDAPLSQVCLTICAKFLITLYTKIKLTTDVGTLQGKQSKKGESHQASPTQMLGFKRCYLIRPTAPELNLQQRREALAISFLRSPLMDGDDL